MSFPNARALPLGSLNQKSTALVAKLLVGAAIAVGFGVSAAASASAADCVAGTAPGGADASPLQSLSNGCTELPVHIPSATEREIDRGLHDGYVEGTVRGPASIPNQ
ncbi:hypothetical protein [Mycobacterium marinum]|uniref:hypothetical protein n=1 Tax=Mycobacterium marinum TaxID=1781 RepID=UPI000358A5CB|nr:hypothetical protein [Mycobacterium marinum]EPQ78366.1 hypothetical protein MMMB2_3028 [Mycobacterium marinum MB2]MDC8973695.1 hypothetical protein [Mycobacterium marinum]MDC8983823.1 hypothetical protein [Mycobacterium marinum]MDC8994582.1 hypothetical protein [Mycobacterium marinum]MDC9000899.1 hypothetical protein [Mycobacterium marinum]